MVLRSHSQTFLILTLKSPLRKLLRLIAKKCWHEGRSPWDSIIPEPGQKKGPTLQHGFSTGTNNNKHTTILKRARRGTFKRSTYWNKNQHLKRKKCFVTRLTVWSSPYLAQPAPACPLPPWAAWWRGPPPRAGCTSCTWGRTSSWATPQRSDLPHRSQCGSKDDSPLRIACGDQLILFNHWRRPWSS